MDLYFKRQSLDNNISFMSWWLQDKERLISEDSSYVVPRKYISYSALVPKVQQQLEEIDKFLRKDKDSFKFIFKEKKEKVKKGQNINKKPKEKTAKQVEALVEIDMASKVMKKLEEQSGIFAMPHFELVQRDNAHVVKELVIRAANITDADIEAFKINML